MELYGGNVQNVNMNIERKGCMGGQLIRRVETMNEFLGNIIEKYGKDVGFALVKAVCSAMCAFITNNILITLIYIFFTTAIDVLAVTYEEVRLENIVNKIFKIKDIVLYTVFIIIAFLPTIICFIFKEISYTGVCDFLIKRSYNWFPNIFGALIICSFIKYLSTLKAQEILCAALNMKRELFDIIMRCGFMIAFLNAINHSLRNEQKIAEFFNIFHLCVVVFLGVVALGAFALWLVSGPNTEPEKLVSETNTEPEKTKIYPVSSLWLCFGFLLSCLLLPCVLENVENEWIMLVLNSITAITVAWSFLIFVKRKHRLQLKDCPIGAVTLFTIGVLIVMCVGVVNMEIGEKSSIIRQLISGTIVLSGTVVLLLTINSIQKKRLNVGT